MGEREASEGVRLAERVRGQEDRAQQLAGGEDVLVITRNEVGDRRLARLAASGPERRNPFQRGGEPGVLRFTSRPSSS